MRTLAEALSSLYARVPFGIRLGLDGMREACRAADHPERAFPAVHVAGTNGKGSVCAMTAAIARAHGLRTGLYTSPHLARFAERIQVDGEPLDDAILAELLSDTLDRAPELTFFEVATLAAFRAFREAKVDLAVLEVGLGGRLDATNVIPPPQAAAVTRIALDHTDRLGTTQAAIAREKAGIAKPGVELVLGPLGPEARAAVEDVARAAGARTFPADHDADAVRIVGSGFVGLPGAHQRDNALIACVLGARVGATLAERALGIARARWAGRLETVTTPDGDVLLDAAHNPDGVGALAAYVAGLGRSPEHVAVVFGALAEKEWEPMVDAVAAFSAHRVYVAPSAASSSSAPKVRASHDPARLAARQPGRVAASAREALREARAAVGADGLVVVCGSILLVGDARSALLGVPRDPPVSL